MPTRKICVRRAPISSTSTAQQAERRARCPVREPRAPRVRLVRPRVRLRAAGRCRHRPPTVSPTRVLQAPVQLLEEGGHRFGRGRRRGELCACRGAHLRGLASTSESGCGVGGGARAPDWRSKDVERVGRGGSLVCRCLLTLLLPLSLRTTLLLSKAMVSAVFGEVGVAVPRVVVCEQHRRPPVDLDQQRRAPRSHRARRPDPSAELVTLTDMAYFLYSVTLALISHRSLTV